MIAPMSANMASVLPDTTTSVPLTPEAPASTPSTSSPPATTPSPGSNQPVKDTVQLSNTAVNMSKALNQQADQRAELKRDAEKSQQSADEAKTTSSAQLGKAYPPFMGNSEELKRLKESSPELYRQVLRMIVPPPLNLSPTDLQALRGSSMPETKSKTEIATA